VINEDNTADKASVIAKVSREDDDDEKKEETSTTTEEGAKKPAAAASRPQKLPFNFSLFHMAFMLGAMYVQQLLTNWETISSQTSTSSTTADEITVDSGPGSVWVKIISSWLVFALYLWSLFAPLIFPDRDFGYGVSYSF